MASAADSLAALEADFALYSPEEQGQIVHIRSMLRRLHEAYPGAAALAMMATSFEIAIEKGQ